MPEFYLSAFDNSFNVTLATMDASAITIPDVSMSFTIDIALTDVKKLFQFDSSGSVGNINDISASDLKYYVDVSKLPNDSTLTTFKSNVTTDYIQYLALQLFNTIRGVDLFNNESDISANIVTNLGTVWTNVTNIVTTLDKTNGTNNDLAGNPKYLTNDNVTSSNLVRQLLLQMVNLVNTRFSSITPDNDTTFFPLPFLVDDTISFILTLNSNANQKNIIGGSGPVEPRKYKISLKVVS